REHHRLFYAEAEPPRSVLLQFACGEGRNRIALFLLRDNRINHELGIFHDADDVLGLLLLLYFRTLAFRFDQTRFELRRLVAFKFRDDRPILLRLECQTLALALHDHSQRDRLHTARGDSATDFVPQQRTDLIT